MKEISMLEFRRHAWRALQAVRRGERFLLTYRGQPIARLEPIIPEPAVVPEDDPLLRIDDFALDGPDDGVSNEQIDRLLYGS